MRLAMSEAVLVTGRPYVVLDVGGVRRRAVYSGPIGSSTDVLDFSYTVQAGDLDTDGVGLCVAGRRPGCGSIDLNGGSIRAAGDESAASLGHPALAAQSGHKVDAAPLPALSTACADEIRVRIDWALKPSSVSAGGTFRLLFVGSVDRNAQSSNIADYNRFVQSLAAAGHSSIRPFKGGFRAVGSTAAVDARDNTCTTGTGVPIHWLNGNQVADNYADFYDNSWDDQANPKTESGNAIGPRNVWTGSNSDGTNGGQPLGNTPGGGRLIRFGTIGQSGGGGSPLSATSALASSSGSALAFYGLSQVFKVPAASDKARTTDIAIISSPAIGDAYRLGETVEVEVMYSEAVTVRGAPLVGLSVKNATGNDDNEYDAAYVRGSGTTKLVFSFTVPSGLRDDDGIQLYSSPLRLNGATITAVSDGDPAVWNLAAERNIGGKVDSSRTPSGGICSRTPQVRDAIVAAVAAASDCSQVTNAYLTALTGTLEFSGLTSIAAGDLAGLSSLTRLNLYGSGIETLPVGLFDGLGSLTRLDVRAGLTHLPKDIFRGLGKVTFLSLDGLEYPESPGNRLREGGLPDGIFEPLSREVKSFWIFGSPGSESFRPRAADAGPGGMLSAGQKVTLGGPGNDGGPWGSNVFYRWRQKDGSGNAVSTVALPVTDEVNVVANPSFTVPTLAETTEVRFQLRLDGAGKKLDGSAHGDASLRLGLYSPVSEARFTILALAPTAVAVVSKPVDGDTYRQGEKIEVAVTFGDRVLVDTSLGTPTLGLAVGTETRQATYVRGTGSNRLVFEYTVQSGDTDGDGIAVAANGLAPGGSAIAGFYGVQAILDHAALAAQAGHKVGGSLTHSFDLTRGVCERTPQVRDKLLELVKAKPGNSGIANCSEVDPEMHLPTLTGTLDLSSAGIATLKQGDFANLGGIDILRLQGNDLTALPASVFDGLTGLSLIINLRNNNLSSLPPRIFEKLTGLTGLSLNDNPGSAGFVPTAKAGPAGGIEVVSGGSVTLGVEGAENGHDDPWGSNVTWSWSRTGGAGGTLTDAAAARATFTAPATGEDGTHVFRLKVIGAGDFAATADVAIRVAAGPKAVEAAFAPVGGTAYAGGETIEVALHFDRAVTVDIAGGTPSVTLTVGAAPRTAGYLRGSGTGALTFGYTVQAADMDADGVDLVANSLALNGGKIAAVSDGGVAVLGHAALAGGSGRTVNVAAARGICDRTATVQTAILERVRADENDASLQCGDIGPVRLVAIGGRLDLSAQARNGRMTALRAGDFAWLANVTGLDLDNHALRSFPAGVFDPLTSLTELSIAYNQTQAADRLTSLPAGLFDGLTKLTTLRLGHNDLETLPDGIFEKLTRLTTLTLHGNPGSAAFLPVAAAGPAGGLEAETGERVTLGGDAGGPWGGNVVHAWRQVSGTAVALSATDAAKPAFAAPALAGPENLAFKLTVTGRGTSLTATDRVSVRIAAAAAVSSVVPASTPIDGDTYRRGETIGIAVGFAKPVTVTGTPQLALSVGTNTRQAAYVRGSGTGQLVFEYTVLQADTDSDGIAIAADSLAPGTGAIADATGMAVLLGHPALAAQAAHRVDGSLTHAFNPTAGICGRTAPVRDGLLLAVRARTGDTALGCAQVTEAHLGALSGTLILAHKGIGTLKPGDFANLGGIAALQLDNNDLTALPAGVFEGLDDTLTVLQLQGNNLSSLPARIFETLTSLTTLSLQGNPGLARFVPVARAGPAAGIEVAQGGSVTLGVEGAAAGYDDPWGANVTYSWSQSAGTAVTYDTGKGAATVRPSFTAPAEDETLTFTLTVTGRGAASSGSVNRHRGASTVSVRVGAAGVRPMPVSAAVNGATLTLTYGEDLQAIDPAAVPVSSRGPAYLPVVSEPGVRRNIETVGVSTARASGRTVIITLARTVVPNQVVTLSYFPDNATAASRVRDRVGNLAGAFAGLRVRNETSQPPVVGDIAFAGAAKTYRIGETVGIDVTFSEPVAVTVTGGAPTLALEIGSANRKARWKAGQAAGAVQRFEYTVAEGEEDKDGIAVKADGLAVPSGSAIVTTAEREAVILGHGRVHDPAHKVDGVRPTVPQIGISPSHCNVSDANELWCATLTVERYEAGGSVFYGYLRSGGYGSVAPDTFTYRGVDVAVSALHKSIRSGTPLRFEVGPASGAAPAGGLLGAVSFSLEIGTGAGRKTLAIETPGTRTGFEFSGHNFEWNNGDRVPVKLVRRGAQATAASISSSPSRGSTYRAGETVTVRLAMSEAVLVTGRPYVVLDVGGVRRRAVYAGPIGSATDVLDFDYTVQAGDFDTDGVALCGRGAGCGRIALDGGSIRASYDGSVASLGHPALGAQSGHKADAAAALTLMPPTACANEIRVPDDWPLTPSGVSAGGKFRLLFVTSTARDATSSNIADYNRFVQNRAAAGHSSIRPYKDGFRAVGSTDAADARDNTCTTGTGVEIHWLNGNKVADDYADFYDDSWDDANLKNEGGNGITGSNIQVFTGSGADGTAAADHYLGVASPNTAVIAIMPSPVRPLASNFGDVRGTRRFYGLSQVFKVPAASDRAHTTDIAIISSPAIGDAYRLGETVEVEVTYSEAVSVRGTPAVGLSVKHAIENYDIEYNAAYVRGSGTTKLVFAFTVPGGLKDDNGILLYSNPLRLNGARIATVSDGSSAAWTLAAWRNIGGKVDTSLPLSGGVCDRTPAVRYAIVAAVTAASDCSQVTEAHLAGMTGTLEFSGLTSIAAGDLAGLSSLTRLNLYGSGIETLPVGLFDGLGSLTRLDVRAGLTHLPKDIFRGLGKVTFLSLDGLEYPESPGNRLREGGLPDGIFEPLSREVKEFWIFGSPGSESFRPRAADAGPGGMLSAGQKVTLGGPGNDGGPWGSNVFYRWRQKDGSGNAVSTVALPVTDEVNVVANPSFTVPTLAEATEVRFQLQLDGAGKKLDGGAHGDASLRLGLYSPVSEARFTILALAPTAVAVVSKPVDGDTYRQGEKIEVAVTFGDRVLVDTSLGTPALGLAVGTETRQTDYVRGTGSNRLVFEYTVQSGDTGSDGIAIAANGLAPGGGAIASVYGVRAILDHAALAAQTGHKVDGSLTHGFDLTGGVCGRTPQVRDKLLEMAKANDSNVTDCSKVTAAHLAALTEQLYLDHAGIATLKRGDFAGLGGIEILTLNANDLTALTAGVFEGLDDTLTLLWLGENDLQTIAPGVFDGLKGLTLLQLTDNDLSLLPPRIFEKLTGLDDLFLGQLPGSARFAPIAKAGPAGGIEVVSGGNVTLGVEGAENGFDDPWGTNVTWAWSRTEGAGGMLADDTAARAAFTAPVTGEDKTYTFRLAVTGSDLYTTTADIAVRVAAGPKAVEAAFAPVGGTAYAGGETIEVALHFDRAVTVDIAGGTPSVTLTVGAAPRTAGYLRGSDTRVLTFGYTVQAADMDADGVDLVANSLALSGGKIAAVSDGGLAALGHAALAGGSGRTVNSPTAGGICDRTAAVQTAILARVRADENDASLQCGDIGPVRLVAIGGRLDLSAQARNGRMTALRAGDFAWLANVTVLDLDNHALRSFPAGIFDPLTALSELSIAYNQTQAADRLTSLPAGLFDRLTKLTTLRLEHNDLETLPDGIFEKLTRLTTLTLHGNPGSAAFLPVAAAGPAGGLEAETGERVTLGGDAGGPWGGNVVHAWRQVSGTAVALSATDAAKPAFAAPALAGPEDLAFELTVTGRGTSLTATDRVSVRIAAAAAVSSVVPASTPIDGDTYRRGETIGIAVGFAKPVTVTGTPQLALSVGTNTRQAAYVRGSGTGQLVFEYPVVQADADSDGIAIAADSLAPGTGAIADATGMAALLGHPALAAQAAHRVDGSLTHAFNPMAGICGRTAPVRDGLLLAVRARTGDTALGCAQVTTTHLGALSGTLILAHKGIGTLKPGDFANLGGIAALQLDNNDLQTIPAGVFDRLTGLTTLSLHDNRLPSLPDRIFEGLMKLTQLSLNGNPGTADFKPTAMAGPEGGIDVPQGATTGITLGVEVPESGYDDPWGTNVTYAWSRTEGTGGTLTDATAAQAVFTPPATDGTHAFRLTVTGGGGVAGTSTVSVHVGAAGVPPMPVSAVVNGPTLTLTYSKNLQAEPPPASDSGKGQVYLAVVSVPGVRRNIEPVPPSAVEVMGRQVILTFKPSIDPNQVVTLSYFPDNATAESRIRDRGGNLADGFAGLRVDNDTPEGNTVQSFAFVGPAKTYRIGDTIGIDVTFAEAVAVTVTGGAPTLALEIGSANRKARWKAGQAAGAVQRFEYTVAEGEEDTDGIAVKADGLAVPSRSSILTTAEREAVILGHGRVHDPAHKVDGVRPTASSARSEGPGVSVIWSEPLDTGAAPAGAGGFTVNVPGAANPVVTAVTISGSVVNLALNAPIALAATGVTVNYTPAATPIRDAAGNAAERFESPLAVTVAVDETPPALTAAAVNGDTLTLTYSEPLKATSPAAAAYSVGVSGGGTFTLSNIRAGVGPGNTQVVMTLDPPAQAGQTIRVAYMPNNATTATKVQDLAGNAAAGFASLSELNPPVTLVNMTGAPTLTLSKPQVTEGDDAQVTLTLSTGNTTYGSARTFTISAGADSTALQGQDWTLSSASVVLPAGKNSVTATLAIVDDARLEPAETASFKASLDGGAETAAAVLAIADDDKAVLAVRGPDGPVTEGQPIELTLRLEPHPENVANLSAVPDDACILDFPVTATLTRAGDTAAALPSDPTLETDHSFAATSFDDCTREVTVSVPTKAPDAVWMADRALTFALAPKNSDPRVEAGEALSAAVRDDTPEGNTVQSFAVTGPAKTYRIGDTIGIDVTFAEAVTVTGAPTLALEIGAARRKAAYVRGSGSAVLTFEATEVALGEEDTDGIAVAANGLEVPSGSSILNTVDREAAILRHGRYHDPAYKVDGVLPAATAASAAGPTVTVTWSEALDEASVPTGAGGFRVRIGNANGPAVSAVAVSGATTTLSLASAIADGTANVKLEYTPPRSGAKIRDAAGNDAEGFTGSDAVAVSVTPDTTAPMVTGAAVDGARLRLTFDEPLDEASVPAAPGGFTVTVTRVDDAVPGHTVSGIAVSGATVTLTLAKGVLPGDTVTLDYVPTSTRLQDRAVTPNPVAGFSGLDMMKTVDNASDALEVSLSTTEAVEGDDGTVTLTVAVAGGGTSGVARAIAIAPVAPPTAAETEDWTLPAGQRSLTLGAGQRSVSAAISVVDDARLEDAETVSFAVTADGAAIGQVTLTIADDDKAVLAVRGPAQVTEGQPIELTLRLEPHPENVANLSAVPDDACILDFPVTATLTRAGDTAAALPSNPTLETDHSFAATSFDDCTREVTVSVPTKAPDAVWMADRALTFALAPKNSDPRVEAGEALSAAVRDDTPEGNTVQSFAVTGPAKTYRIGDTIGIDVTFAEAVTVTGAPTLALEIGAARRKAAYVRGSGSAVLTFEATEVALGEEDTDGIAVAANGLEVPSGSSILNTVDREAAILRHGRYHDPAYKVDGVLPAATAASAAGPTVTVTWSEALDEASVPTGAGGFRVRIGNANGPAVSAVAVSGATTTLSLASAIADGTANVKLEYTPPRSGAKIRDAAGNDAEGFTGSDAVAVSVTPDTTAPMVTGAAVDGARLRLTFDEPLDEASVPAAPGGFTVTVTRVDDAVPGHTVSGIAVSGATVTLTLAKGVLPGDTVTLDYVPTSTRLQDRAVTPNPVAGFSGLDMMKTVDNASDALEVSLSTTEAVEGDDGTVTLTVAVAGGGTSGVARAIAIAPVAPPTAAETEDWTLPAGQRSLTLGAGQRSVSAAISVVDDARLEDAETVSFAVTADGAAIGQVTLTIADDDKAVLAVRGPAQVTEGQPIELTLRLEPHPENVANLSAVPDDACILDFPVTATLTRAGDTAAALPSNPTLETDHSFAATSFDDCTREVTVSVPTRAPDAVWMADRALTFALAPKNSDPRVEAGEALSAAVRDDTPLPGPMVTGISISPGARTCDRPDPVNPSGYTKEEFLALPGCAVHGRGTTLTFTLTFDSAVTVTRNAQTRALPELVLDVFGRERRAQLSGNRTDTGTLTFTWTVAKGDNDPDGIGVARIDLKGASIRFAAGCMPGLPCDIDVPTFKSDHAQTYPKHRVRGGLHAMRLSVSGSAREGEPFTVTVRRDGGYKETAHAIVRMTDSGVESPGPGEASAENHGVRLMSFPFDADPEQGEDSRVSVQTVTPPGDGVADARTLTFKMFATDVGDSGVSYWYVTRDPVEATVTVTDTGLAGGTPDGPSLGVWDDWTREPTQEQWDRGRRFPLRFDVTVPWPNVLRPRGEAKVTVQYETRDGTATVADRDYVATRGTLTFEPGETRKTVVVQVRPDRHDEGEETMTLVLSSATGAAIVRAEAVGTIRNNGPIPKAWIARFGRTVAEQVLEAIEGRMRATPAPGAEVALAGERIGAQSPDRGPDRAEPGSDAEREARQEEEARRDTQRLAGWLKGETDPEEAQRLTSRAVTPRDLLTGSSFALTAETDGKDLVSLWGRAAVTRFDGREGDLMLAGEVVTGMLGADWTGGRWTAGLIVSHSTAEGGYSGAPVAGDAGSGGKVEATLTGLFPWARHALSERLEAWGAAGYGAGELTVTPKAPGTGGDGPAIHADLDLRMAAVGLRGTILDGGADGLTLIGKIDAMAVQTASGRGRGTDGGNLEPARATVSRLRLGLEASRPILFDGGFTLTPSLEIGVRHDGGDAETGFGLDLGGGLALSDPKRGLQAELRGRGLLTHESKGFRDLGFSGSLAWEGNPGSNRGAKLRLTQTVGGSSSGGADALLSRTTLEGLAANDDGAGGNDELKSRRLELKFGYGLSAFGDRFTWTPEVGVDLSDTGRDYSLGWRLVLDGSGSDGGALELSFEATRRESANDDTPPVHEVGLRLTARF